MVVFRNVLVVCVGNICRSPTAEKLLDTALQFTDIKVSSAGLAALADHPLDPTAGLILKEHGYTPHVHRARQLSREAVNSADLVLVMEQRHIEAVLNLAPEARGKVFLLGKWQDEREISDPYRQGKPAFLHAYVLIEQAVETWVRRLTN